MIFYQTLWLGMAIGFILGVIVTVPIMHFFRKIDDWTLTGKALDKTAAMYNVKRRMFESDKRLRKRIMNAIRKV